MLSKINTASLYGLEGSIVTVETDISRGALPSLNLVGLPDMTVREAKERIRSAILNSGYPFPVRRITINLSPANTKKEGSHFDLPMALGILTSNGDIEEEKTEPYAFLGELSLDGKLNAVQGALPLVMKIREAGIKKIILPQGNVKEASLIQDVMLYPMEHLTQIVDHFSGESKQNPYINEENHLCLEEGEEDFLDVAGQDNCKRAVTISGAGFHGIFLFGFPGSGKTMIAKRIPTIMPELSYEESLEATRIYSIAGELSTDRPMIIKRPFRNPHHSISSAALIGGGIKPRPGEFSLAHYGVLFLDEFPEFSRHTLELLRQPLEDEKVTINRIEGSMIFPGKVLLVAASNPCRCGYNGDDTHKCICSQADINRYMSRLSGPILDRIDMHVEVMPVKYNEILEDSCKRKSSSEMRQEVMGAVTIQRERYKKESILYNSQLTPGLMKKYCVLDNDSQDFMKQAFEKLAFSARSHGKVIKVARTIADLEASSNIEMCHLAEALRYRNLDRLYENV